MERRDGEGSRGGGRRERRGNFNVVYKRWIQLETIILSKISQIQRIKYIVFLSDINSRLYT